MNESPTSLIDFKRELAALATLRDEVKLKAHLGRAELKTQLEDLERRWLLAEEQLLRAKDHLRQDTAMVEHKVALLLNDLKLGYQNVKRSFESE